MTTNDVAQVYDTLLSIPGMNEQVKVDFRISRKTVLLLSQVIKRGIAVKPDDQACGLPEVVSKESIQELEQLVEDCLQKSGLTELNGKLGSLHAK